ncbi:hypothetical protein B3286c2_0504 [Brucella vulpis]|nr:hypothetical protein BF3285c2_0509 [Brucella vulpis]CUW51522.1 hypothetical protein B3286c2_0504 [Brucella vulpis]
MVVHSRSDHILHCPTFPHSIAECLENFARRRIGLDPVFRVPLDADDKSPGVLHRHGFDRAVLGNGFDLKPGCELVDSLPVNGIHLHAFFLQDFRKA